MVPGMGIFAAHPLGFVEWGLCSVASHDSTTCLGSEKFGGKVNASGILSCSSNVAVDQGIVTASFIIVFHWWWSVKRNVFS